MPGRRARLFGRSGHILEAAETPLTLNDRYEESVRWWISLFNRSEGPILGYRAGSELAVEDLHNLLRAGVGFSLEGD